MTNIEKRLQEEAREATARRAFKAMCRTERSDIAIAILLRAIDEWFEKGKAVENGLIPPRMIHQSFRYVLGRTSYAVSEWCDWACENWEAIPDEEKAIIKRELEEAFDRDDKCRACPGREKYRYPLGHDGDRACWEKVRAKYK